MFSLNLIFAAIIYLNITIVSSLKTLLTETVLEKVVQWPQFSFETFLMNLLALPSPEYQSHLCSITSFF